MANSKQEQKPEWSLIVSGLAHSHMMKIEWCRGCGCLKITRDGNKKILYRVPRREKQRRQDKKDSLAHLNAQRIANSYPLSFDIDGR